MAPVGILIARESVKRAALKLAKMVHVVQVLRDILQHKPGIPISAAVKLTGSFHWDSPASAKSGIKRMLDRGNLPGVTYRLNKHNVALLYRTEDAPKETEA
jgi:hypothetical protein